MMGQSNLNWEQVADVTIKQQTESALLTNEAIYHKLECAREVSYVTIKPKESELVSNVTNTN